MNDLPTHAAVVWALARRRLINAKAALANVDWRSRTCELGARRQSDAYGSYWVNSLCYETDTPLERWCVHCRVIRPLEDEFDSAQRAEEEAALDLLDETETGSLGLQMRMSGLLTRDARADGSGHKETT